MTATIEQRSRRAPHDAFCWKLSRSSIRRLNYSTGQWILSFFNAHCRSAPREDFRWRSTPKLPVARHRSSPIAIRPGIIQRAAAPYHRIASRSVTRSAAAPGCASGSLHHIPDTRSWTETSIEPQARMRPPMHFTARPMRRASRGNNLSIGGRLYWRFTSSITFAAHFGLTPQLY